MPTTVNPASRDWSLSALLTSLPLDFESAVRQLHALGFGCVDVVARSERPEAHREALADTGLLVACAAIGRHLPAGHTLDAPQVELRRTALDEMQLQIADAACLGATHGYLVPGTDNSREGLVRFLDACAVLADFAGARMVRLCVEPVPGKALPTTGAVLSCLEHVRHPNLALLLDVGHCLITQEDPVHVVEQAGPRLGYVHVDDNDGQSDLHWPLLAGRLTEPLLAAFLGALRAHGYGGIVSLELNPQNADPVAALRQGKELLERLTARIRLGEEA